MPPSESELSRRRVLAASAAVGAAVAGCVGSSDDGDDEENGTQRPEVIDEEDRPVTARVEDPPDAVYKPTHVQSVGMLESVQAGDVALLPHYTYSHKFWLMRGDEREAVRPEADELHLMLAFWDAETRTILPVDAGQRIEIRRDGDVVAGPFQPWPMLSQQMGFHFGDNVAFPEAGTYTIDLQMGPIDVRKTGGFAGRFEETVSASFEFEYDPSLEQAVVEDISYLDESEWGEPGAVPLMTEGGMDHGGGMEESNDGNSGMEMTGPPALSLPPATAYPGRDLGTDTSDDARVVVRYLADSRLSPDGEGYLLVSPRTPYNRVPLPGMALAVEGDVSGLLEQTLDSDLGHHYGLAVTLDDGDSVDVVVQTPPQVARHRGYETAFLDMEPFTVELE